MICRSGAASVSTGNKRTARHAAPIACVLLPVLILSGAGACTMRITPPPVTGDVAAVFVIDYGYHSSLLLPTESAELVEYAYGEWEWFALGREQWHRVPVVLFWPTQGTLGRRILPARPAASDVARIVAAESVHEIFVPAARAGALRRLLDARIDAAAPTRVYTASLGLEMFHADPPYWVFHHCNSAVADWLRELGCSVHGEPLIAEFEVATVR